MAGYSINQFMWGYQAHYRIFIQLLARTVLEKLGAPNDAEVLLIGARCPNSNRPYPVCVEPEDGKWVLSLFDDLLDTVESNCKNHHLQSMIFGDEPSMRDKPEWIRCDSVRTAVGKMLEIFDAEYDVTSFCGEVKCVDEYYVTPVIQIPNTIFRKFPPLAPKPINKQQQKVCFRSLIHASMYEVLHEAANELHKTEPGRSPYDSMRNAEEIVRVAAKKFLHTPGLSIERNYMYSDLFDNLNLISSLMYEGMKGIGQLILVDPTNDAVEFLARFVEPVPFSQPRWIRKVLQLAATGIGIIATSEFIYGLGRLKASHDPSMQDAFKINFIDHYQWELCCGSQALLRSQYAVPKLPQEPFDKAAFLANYARLFPLSSQANGQHLWSLLQIQVKQEHGSMIVVAEDAVNEAHRLGKQGTRIEPCLLTETLFQSFSGIDGAILLDPGGLCHAIGIILDGEATDQCTPSRGSRYNSGVRYVQKSGARRLAIVASDDRTIDIIPTIKRLVSRSMIEQRISELEMATPNNYHDPRNWLDEHRFYINAEQCARINIVIDRLDAQPARVGIYLRIDRFEVDPKMNESYLTD